MIVSAIQYCCKCRGFRWKVPLFAVIRSILIACRLQSTDLLTPVDNLADSKSTGVLTPSQQVV
ncbi:MAG: hypothetical protein IJ069_00940 [Prevotella sp.]|nr:hypothetical protein [Prevotella sp.]